MADDAAQDLALRFQEDQRRLQAIDRHLAALEQNLAELNSAISTLDGLVEAESLVPIGGGIRIRANLVAGPVLMDVGAGSILELSPEDAMERLRARQEATESAFRSANAEADRVTQRLQEMQQQAS